MTKTYIKREDLPEDYAEMMQTETHHDHRIIRTENGSIRWEANPATEMLLEMIAKDAVSKTNHIGMNLNDVVGKLISKGLYKNSETYRQLYRDMGYSLNGYWEIFYWEANNEEADQYKQPE